MDFLGALTQISDRRDSVCILYFFRLKLHNVSEAHVVFHSTQTYITVTEVSAAVTVVTGFLLRSQFHTQNNIT